MDFLKQVSEKGLSSLEKMTEFKYFTLLWSMIFALDIYILHIYETNLIQTFIAPNTKVNLIHSIVFIALFSFSMVLFFPTMRYLLRSIFLYFSEHKGLISEDYKYLFSVKKQAIQSKDSFTLSLVEKEELANKQGEQELNIVFTLCCLSFIDFFFSKESIINYFINLIQKQIGFHYIIYCSMCLVYVLIMLFWFYTSVLPYQVEQIYYPDSDSDK